MDTELLQRRLLRWCLAIGQLTGLGLLLGLGEGLLAQPLPHETLWQRASTLALVDGLAGCVLGSALGWLAALSTRRPGRSALALAAIGPAVLLTVIALRAQQLDDGALRAVDGPLRLERPLPPLASPEPRLVVVVTLDTFRADALAHAPALQTRLRRGRHYPQARAAGSWTLPSLAAMFTGRSELEHGAGMRLDPAKTWLRSPLSAEATTLAESLQDRGFITAAVTSNPYLGQAHGLGRGFDRHWDLARANVVSHALRRSLLLRLALPERLARGDAVTDRALALLPRMAGGRALLWVHYTDPHAPYRRAPGNADPLDPCAWPDCFGDWRAVRRGEADPDRAAVQTLYEADISWLDGELDRLFSALDGLETPPLVVVAGDHGEAFGRGDDVEHGHAFTDAVLRVPLGAWGRGVSPGTSEVPTDVRLVHGAVLRWADTGRWSEEPLGPLPMRSLLFGPPAEACLVDGALAVRRSVVTGEARARSCLPPVEPEATSTAVEPALGLELLGYLE